MTPSSPAGKSSTDTDGTIGQLGEFGLIKQVVQGRAQPAPTLLGPGDDAAVIAAFLAIANASTSSERGTD